MSAMLLSNLTRFEEGSQELLQVKEEAHFWGYKLIKLLHTFCFAEVEGEEMKRDRFGWIATILMNVTQSDIGRRVIFDPEKQVLKQLLPFLEHKNVMRRRGVAGALRNCLVLKEQHEWAVSPQVDILSSLLFPLLDQSFQFKESEKKVMSPMLSNIHKEKKREEDPMCRKLLVESLFLLSKNRKVNEMMRKIQVYPIIRELDSLEDDEEIKQLLLSIVEYLILDWEKPQEKSLELSK